MLQEREESHGYEAEEIAREEAVGDCQRRESEEEAAAQTEQQAAEKQLALKKDQLNRAKALLTEPEKGPDVSQVLLWLPTGGRKQRRFESSAKVEAIYDYIDSLGTIGPGRYSLVSNFPRIVYGPDKMNLTLRIVGLHPTASLFVEMN
jgi:FAS-associated factor 2